MEVDSCSTAILELFADPLSMVSEDSTSYMNENEED